jgi:integrase/recombinase XerD
MRRFDPDPPPTPIYLEAERGELKRESRAKLHRIVTNRQKTGTYVSISIPPDVAAEIETTMMLNDSPKYQWSIGAS